MVHIYSGAFNGSSFLGALKGDPGRREDPARDLRALRLRVLRSRDRAQEAAKLAIAQHQRDLVPGRPSISSAHASSFRMPSSYCSLPRREGFPVTASVTATGISGDRWGPDRFLNHQPADPTGALNPVRIPLSPPIQRTIGSMVWSRRQAKSEKSISSATASPLAGGGAANSGRTSRPSIFVADRMNRVRRLCADIVRLSMHGVFPRSPRPWTMFADSIVAVV